MMARTVKMMAQESEYAGSVAFGMCNLREFSCVPGRPVEAENVLETNQPTNHPTDHSLITDHYPN